LPACVLEPGGQRERRLARVAVDGHRRLLDEAEHLRIGVDLDQLRVRRPVIEAVLRQHAERPEPRTQREHHVGAREHLHRAFEP
jgi:hypothetical protein